LPSPQAIGLSAIGALLQPVGRREPGGLAVQLAHRVTKAASPRRADDDHAARADRAGHGAAGAGGELATHGRRRAACTVQQSAGTVALDGERELILRARPARDSDAARERLSHLDVARCMAVAARDGLLRTSPNRTRRQTPGDTMAGNPFPQSKEQLLQAYRTMRTIREFEERLHIDFAAATSPASSTCMPARRPRAPAS
jgi:hypothetical protein